MNMNGKMTRSELSALLRKQADELGESESVTYDINALYSQYEAMANEAERLASVSVAETMHYLFTNGGIDQVTQQYHSPEWWSTHKLNAIRELRARHNASLKAAKEAYEEQLPACLHRLAREALIRLEGANRGNPHAVPIRTSEFTCAFDFVSPPF